MYKAEPFQSGGDYLCPLAVSRATLVVELVKCIGKQDPTVAPLVAELRTTMIGKTRIYIYIVCLLRQLAHDPRRRTLRQSSVLARVQSGKPNPRRNTQDMLFSFFTFFLCA